MFNFTLQEIKKRKEHSKEQFSQADSLLLADLDTLNKNQIFQVFEKYNFKDEIGCPLTNNLHFLELVELAINT